jgi:predicted amidohydrolase YtcJ
VGEGEPRPTTEERRAQALPALELAAQEVLSKGVTSFQDAGSSFADIDLMKSMVDDGKMGVRLWVMIRQPNDALRENLAKYRMVDYGNGFLTVRGIKHSIDGALGPRGAWLLEPYADKPDSTGLNTTPVDTIAETAKLALEHGYQLCVHAIGDRANRETLDLFEQVFAANPDRKDLRWRVEHAQHLHPADIPRFGTLGVIASMQGVHCTSDAPYVLARLGERRAEEGAYVWQKLMQSGALVSNGTDAPVEDVDPIASYYATVSRKLSDGTVFFPDQRMNRVDALKSYTINAAYAAFEEDSKGTLKPGKYADLVVLSKDILTIPEDEIPTAEVRYTIVGGKIRYRSRAGRSAPPPLKGGPTARRPACRGAGCCRAADRRGARRGAPPAAPAARGGGADRRSASRPC